MDFPTLITLIISAIPVVYGVLFLIYQIDGKSKPVVSAKDFMKRFLLILCIVVGLLLFAFFFLNKPYEENGKVETRAPSIPAESNDVDIEEIPLTQCMLLADTNLSNSTSDVCVGTWVDTHGNIYLESIRFWVWDIPSMSAAEHVVYQLDGEYTTLAGTFVAERDSSPDAQFKFSVYLDGQLQYESQEIGSSSEPINFSIDISDANTIRIECSTDTPYSGYCIVSTFVS